MNALTRAALEESIAHWERLASGNRRPWEGADGEDCSLCMMFNRPEEPGPSCAGCPVAERTGETGCRGTPFHDAFYAAREQGFDSKAFRDAARVELEFLRGLLLEHLTDAELDEVIAKEARGG